MTIRDAFIGIGYASRGVGIMTVLCCGLAACGGGSTQPSGGGTNPPTSTTTSLTCSGYPRTSVTSINGTQQTSVQVCLILQDYAQITSSVGASTHAGDIAAHGGPITDAFVVYARIVAQAADEGAATALAKSVVVTTTNGTIAVSPDQVDSPRSLEVDFEIFTATGTNLTLSTQAGNIAADGYDSTLHLSSQSGNVSLQNVQGQVNAEVGSGNIDVKLTGSGWSGAGMAASTGTGNLSLSRPAAYQASITARADTGTASIDGNVSTSTAQGPAIATAGSGAPIVLESTVGNVLVVATQ